jgi:hypothetical protein
MTRPVVTENILTQMELYIKANGQMINKRVKAMKNGLMELGLKEIINKDKNSVKFIDILNKFNIYQIFKNIFNKFLNIFKINIFRTRNF